MEEKGNKSGCSQKDPKSKSMIQVGMVTQKFDNSKRKNIVQGESWRQFQRISQDDWQALNANSTQLSKAIERWEKATWGRLRTHPYHQNTHSQIFNYFIQSSMTNSKFVSRGPLIIQRLYLIQPLFIILLIQSITGHRYSHFNCLKEANIKW